MTSGSSVRHIGMSRNGRWLLVRDDRSCELVDLAGTMPTRTVPVHPRAPCELVGRSLWLVEGDELVRRSPGDLQPLGRPARVPPGVTAIVAAPGATQEEALLVGPTTVRAVRRDSALVVEEVAGVLAGEHLLALHGTRIYAAASGVVRAVDRGREVWRAALDGTVVAGAVLFGGRSLAVHVRGRASDVVHVVMATGARVHQIAAPASRQWAVAEELGHAFLLGDDGDVTRLDLRYGRALGGGRPIVETVELAVDQDAHQIVLVGADAREAIHVPVSAYLLTTTGIGRDEVDADPDADEAAVAEVAPPAVDASRAVARPAEPPPIDARSAAPAPVAPAPPPVEIPALLPLALGPAPEVVPPGATTSGLATGRAHLDALLDIVAARAAVAIAAAWNSGSLSPSNATHRPHEREVEALIGASGGFADDKLAATRQRLQQRQDEASARAQASSEAGVRLPFPTLAREFGLSAVAAQVLLVAVAPGLRGEIARLYGVLTNDPARGMVDRYLVEQIIADESSALRDQIARELAVDAPLVRHGLVHVEPATTSLFSRLTVPEAVLDRLRGHAPVRADESSQVRRAEVALEDLFVAAEIKRRLVLALAQPAPAHAPLRLVLRGRRGSGRHSLLAALAARCGREIVAVDAARLPRARRDLVPALRNALFRASLHGLVPMVSGLELIEPGDAEVRDAVRQVLRAHPGPLVVRTSPESLLPLDPGFLSIALPALSETERARAWAVLLRDAGLTADADGLASRYRIGPGVIRHVIAEVAALAPGDGDVSPRLDEQVRQHVATRLDHVAKHIERTAQWQDVVLPDEVMESLREFIGRARHRRTVYEQWGYDSKMTSSRGLTALFYGPPGTGKSMVAGVMAQELGLDMYRVDLARVVSKWVGETEKNLAEVFDAAEDGQVLILFDEADSLFAKRTDVRTSNDRYANLEVNYLLQRLDTFEGIAVLTSNLDGSIDPAFKRRLSLRLQFPFPDEETRARLWASHITSETPIANDFDFIELARRFPLSGGYIRNCALRAAFLAAHDGRPMSQDHLQRAIQLEYREIGKLSTTSRLE
jgi:hypothetical protein